MLDADGVMYEWDRTARYMLREVLPNSPYADRAHPLFEESKHWNWVQEHIEPKHWRWLWKEGVALGLFRHGHLYPGTVKAVRKLATLGELTLITSRPKTAVGDTLAWAAYNQFPISDIRILSSGEKKSSVRPHCDIYLDDRVENVLDLAGNTDAVVCLWRRPWNSYFTPDAGSGIVVIETWDEYINIVREL